LQKHFSKVIVDMLCKKSLRRLKTDGHIRNPKDKEIVKRYIVELEKVIKILKGNEDK